MLKITDGWEMKMKKSKLYIIPLLLLMYAVAQPFIKNHLKEINYYEPETVVIDSGVVVKKMIDQGRHHGNYYVLIQGENGLNEHLVSVGSYMKTDIGDGVTLTVDKIDPVKKIILFFFEISIFIAMILSLCSFLEIKDHIKNKRLHKEIS